MAIRETWAWWITGVKVPGQPLRWVGPYWGEEISHASASLTDWSIDSPLGTWVGVWMWSSGKGAWSFYDDNGARYI